MTIHNSQYQLQKKTKLNSQDISNTQSGVLIKIIEDDTWGVADLSPKPELGDDSSENEIKYRGPLFLRALELAQEDLQARKEKKSLLQNKPITNNFLILDYRNANLNDSLYKNQTVKIKADRDIHKLSVLLNEIVIDVKIRLDFNSILSAEEFETFLRWLSAETMKKIEYIEDPTLFSEKWKSWNAIIPLAYDFQNADYRLEYAKYRIIKPSRQKLIANLENFTLTATMEHPVGLAHGLRMAQQYAKNVSGFLTLDLFESGEFNKYFEQNQNQLNFTQLALNDFGIGMSEELNKMQWALL